MAHPARSVSVVVAGLFILAFLPGSAQAGKQARVEFKAQTHDFGKIKQGDVLSHEFIFRNIGDGVLVVEEVETSCGCAAALVSDKKIEPGKEGRIKATLDTRGYSGRVTKYIYFKSNDAEDAHRELAISAEIEVPPSARIELDKYNLDLGLLLEGEEARTKVVLTNAGELELKVEIAHQEIRFLVDGKPIAFPLRIAAGKSVELELAFPPLPKVGLLRDYVLIKSNDPVRSTLSLYLSRFVITRAELKKLFIKYRKVLED